ncbi:imidazole glycerol phosphate synthase subunit HisH [Helicobacter monodelphidis]|uniref:imidazole glycerol phosphate synthase subunit HisH n=1 Tax=Helicobacter sp. 15-1451 TaxID=2004995 RepID=UPI000DCB5953|nr:imidazole glycerol phosphate synthase subunit HisH [Helicobacter sp. 15-1451]RAX57247.1 imidazole glycerol phosphate synthase subunit HisH [Helicobacter sp. 15-1451]
MKQDIAIIDYGVGNYASIFNALQKIGANPVFVKNPQELKNFRKILLPGVGAFGQAMESLKKNDMHLAIREYADNAEKQGCFLLGICLGMQLLFEKSYEFGVFDGLGLIQGEVLPFDVESFSISQKVPHIGWNSLKIQQQDTLFDSLKDAEFLYFVHSYHVVPSDNHTILATTNYGYEFVSIVRYGHLYGIQPHPEKSHNVGLRVLENFCKKEAK